MPCRIAHISGFENGEVFTVINARVDWPTILEVTFRAGQFCQRGVARPRDRTLVASDCRSSTLFEFCAGYDAVPFVDFVKKVLHADSMPGASRITTK